MTQLLVKAYSAFSSLLSREEGQTLVEYAIILAAISVAVIAVLKVLGTDVSGMFSKVNADLP
jgi:pilus assembly protein Flp/PilA